MEPHLDDTVIGRFEHIQGDIADLVRRVNTRFGTLFRAEAAEVTPQSELGWHAMPNDIRRGIKRDLDIRFESALANSPALRRLLARADAIHARYLEANERHR